ncbi:hypothetical protein [Chromobacterium aquaticum]|uniref:Uncharacterized protein n=1 Tax=Chromobacterium aquaticum TaxID=467180 RepID=A0ABV9A180_9NEIS|nr:hypothetical protein [Chromobacterium aquaticum]MCD5363550.1 hypothetical protein [Chromobacterium aquaticum]
MSDKDVNGKNKSLQNANSMRQAAFKERMRAQGFIQVALWMTPDEENEVRAFLKRIREEKNSISS